MARTLRRILTMRDKHRAHAGWERLEHVRRRSKLVCLPRRALAREFEIDTVEKRVIHTFSPGKAVLHMEFTPRGDEVWLSARDSNRVTVMDTASFAVRRELAADAPSGIFFTSRAQRIGF